MPPFNYIEDSNVWRAMASVETAMFRSLVLCIGELRTASTTGGSLAFAASVAVRRA